MSKKFFFVLSIAILAFAVLTGCSNAEEAALPGDTTGVEESSPSVETGLDEAAPLMEEGLSPEEGKPPVGEKPPPEREKGPRPFGLVTAIGEGQITVENPKGEFTILITEETVFRLHDGSEASFEDIEAGRWVGGAIKPNEGGDLVARVVVLLPEDFDPSARIIQMRGEVEKINHGLDELTLTNPKGETHNVAVDENTKFRGSLTSLKDLEKGMVIGVAALVQEEGEPLLAKVITDEVPEPEGGKRPVGQITALGEDQFTVEGPKGEATILVTDETKYYFHDRSEASFDDLEVGRWVAGAIRPNEDGELVALVVVILPEDFEPRPPMVQMRGEIEKIKPGLNEFTITNPKGESVAVAVDEETQYMGSLTSFDDLEKGMEVGFSAQPQGEGEPLLAKVVTDVIPARVGGEVVSVDESSLTITTREGGEISFAVTEDTQFRSPDGSLTSLEDLEAGQIVIVLYTEEDGVNKAIAILAGKERPPEDSGGGE